MMLLTLLQEYGSYGGYGTSEMTGSVDMQTLLLSSSGWVVWLGMMIWQKVFNKENKAHEQLIDQLTARISTLETSQKRLERELDTERRTRQLEQSKVHLLELYVVALKAELRRHGIEVPAPITLDELQGLLGEGEDDVDETTIAGDGT